ncbi:hypothetical protein DL98DRAFT_564143 [Cadophora sp. DSE1049]|nr:hypothetical protein DL98DRAFT_564143 [Cadophora sp. DSE1049]
MRLLQYNNGSDFCVTEFFESDIPKYAILSHRWGPKEVTLADLKNSNGKKMGGYSKIQFCGEQAKRDGLQYFWVETCYIDKSNSTELAEAINSIFRWYQKAARCYVYLSDVSTRKRKASDTANECTWESAFRDSEWFTRGWTLQELLTPRSVEFFSYNRERLGDKGTLKRQIQEITAIPISALEGALLSQFSIEERLSWAENRQTTREENMAYSLLGIFSIHLPLIYSKGKEHARLLWIKGDPGKGKTMLISGILDEMSPSTKLRDKQASTLLSYFFCQATDDRINNASAVLRGLIYLLIDQQPLLISHVRKKYDHAGNALFKDPNAWITLSEIFTSILQDPSLKITYLIIDALDECKANLDQLLDLISRTASISTRVKWIVSSRNEPNIEARLRLNHTQTRLSLKLNEEHVSRAVQVFIDFKVSKLRLIKDDGKLQETVRGQIYAKANGTFLWAALVLKELKPIKSWDVLDILQDIPPELEPLYDRILRQVEQLHRRDPEFCRLVLFTITLAYRPLHLLEIGALSDLPRQISSNLDKVMKVVNKCGSFLTVRDNRTYFIHQSAKDFLLERAFDKVFPSGKADVIYTMFSKSLEIMSKTLRRDIYGLRAPGFPIEMVEPPVNHLLNCDKGHTTINLINDSSVYQFLKTNYIFWLEALSLTKRLPDGIVIIIKLENWIKVDESPKVHAFIHNTRRFALHNRSIIEQVPLQAYCSALIFTPKKSFTAMLQTLEGHSRAVISVACSFDGKQVVSGSNDKTVRLWDAATGALQQTLEGHSDWTLEGYTGVVYSVAFSPDGKQVVSGSADTTVRLWDAATRAALQTLEGHSDWGRIVVLGHSRLILDSTQIYLLVGKIDIDS